MDFSSPSPKSPIDSMAQSQETFSASLRTGDLTSQWKWHETFRDTAKNMYRTSYTDMIHGREMSVTSDFPSGYGGHIPRLRHDVLFRNTGFDRQRALMQNDVNRDTFCSFVTQLDGIPTYTKKPRGAKNKVPTAGTIAMTATCPPWAMQLPLRAVPTYRTVLPSGSPLLRKNEAAKVTGEATLTDAPKAAPERRRPSLGKVDSDPLARTTMW